VQAVSGAAARSAKKPSTRGTDGNCQAKAPMTAEQNAAFLVRLTDWSPDEEIAAEPYNPWA